MMLFPWQIRSGEYEGLESKLKKLEWAPDFGQADFVPSWGATVTGVRKFLIAYNINLVSTKEQAHRIALNLRTQGRNGGPAGRLKAVQGIGWWLAEKNIAQVCHIKYQSFRLETSVISVISHVKFTFSRARTFVLIVSCLKKAGKFKI